ncbi:kappaPI-actitoxin-Avd3c-like [Scaptodrosophila lebanonensis]|uniref:KappaPI-actitoxin-Avd3c-like n=1 Tax=Drosophila lebanonensis TaxID=7225 RepID=A0A6J2T5F8_DROLE|nr:kappaPI-actitoxin-Avd3c-like [Scaptodrosophila lebanonensis]
MRIFPLLFVLSLLLLATDARRRRTPSIPSNTCKGKPNRQQCEGPLDLGSGGRRCRRSANNNMWYYNAAMNRTCIKMAYKGCGGNNNRWCSKQDCETKCRR